MINKLPVVGKRYRLKKFKDFYCQVFISQDCMICYGIPHLFMNHTSLDYFWELFEELPEDKAETKPETQSSELSPEVKDAMEELRTELDKYSSVICFSQGLAWSAIKTIKPSAENLLNALDKQFMSKKENKIDIKQECVDSVKVNETSESVDVKKEEVKENPKEQHFLAKIDYIRNAQINLSRNLEKISQDIMKKKS